MQKWIIKFLRKFENRGLKIVKVKSILIAKSINSQLFTLRGYGHMGVSFFLLLLMSQQNTLNKVVA